MKNYSLRLCAMTIMFIAQHIYSQDLPSMPTRNSILEWLVTNSPNSVVISVQRTNNMGGLSTCGMNVDNITFGSYDEFYSFCKKNCLRLVNILGSLNPNSEIRLRISTKYGAQKFGLSVDTHFPSSDIVQAQTYLGQPSTLSTALIFVPISGVTNARVGFGTGPMIDLDLWGTNGILYSASFATNTGRVRIMVTLNDGRVVNYMQNGNPILPPHMSLFYIPPLPVLVPHDPSDDWMPWYERNEWFSKYQQYYSFGDIVPGSLHVLVEASAGADTVVEGTSNFTSWTNLGSISWDSGSETMIFPLKTNEPSWLFRARSY